MMREHGSRGGGFTLVEAMTVIAIIATLAAIAVPSYASYVKRSRILEAIARLADASSRMEQYFQDERSYVDAGGNCGASPAPVRSSDAFTLACTATATTFVYSATGRADHAMAEFAYDIDQAGARHTLSLPANWVRATDCWTLRADGQCT